MSYAIVTDTAANLKREHIDRYEITVIPLSYYIEDEEHVCTDPDAFNGPAFYHALAGGARAHTSQIPPQRYIDSIEPLLKAGRDVLFVGLSSGVSGSYASAETAMQELAERYPERRMRLVDTMGASLGEGLQVLRACDCREQGMRLDETADLLLERRARMSQLFTVDDLMHLRKTGRISGVVAIVGTMLNIKPLLKGNEDGKIVSCGKARGRKQAIRTLAERYAELVEHPETQTIGISHANCPEDASLLENLIRQLKPPKDILCVMHEPVTGVHVGPGMLAVYFEGGADVRLK